MFNETTIQFPMPLSERFATSITDVALNITIVDDPIYEMERECFTCTITTTSVPEKEIICPNPVRTICIVDPGE